MSGYVWHVVLQSQHPLSKILWKNKEFFEYLLTKQSLNFDRNIFIVPNLHPHNQKKKKKNTHILAKQSSLLKNSTTTLNPPPHHIHKKYSK